MNEINRQVDRAHRRLFAIELVQSLCICLFVCLTLAVVGLAIPKIWHIPFLSSDASQQQWNWWWVGGGLAVGILAAIVWSVARQGNRLGTAIEVDHRFGLKERLSSALALTAGELESEAGKALVDDASRRAETIDVRDQFKLETSRQMWLPIVPIILAFVLFFVPNAAATEPLPPKPDIKKHETKVAIEETRKKLQKKIEEMEAKGLKDAAQNLKSLQKKIDNMSSKMNDDKKQTLVELNNVKKSVEERQRQIGGDSKELKKQLNQLNKINDGPAKKLSEALNEGDFKEAGKAIKDLLSKMKEGKLTESEKRKLAKDIAKIAKELNDMADRHEQAKRDLQDKIDKAAKNGDLEKAAKLQQKLDKMKQQDQQMQKMKKMAQKLQKCSNCMKEGNGQPKQGQQQGQSADQQGNQPSDADIQNAIESLEDMEDMMKDLQDDMDELQDLEDIMQDIEAAKNNCNGCEGGQGKKPGWNDWAKGAGPGGGKREKGETETGTFKSRVKGKLQKGETVVTGQADGKNITGKSISEVREIAESSMNKKSDPLENQKLPKSQREHAREYFEQLRGD